MTLKRRYKIYLTHQFKEEMDGMIYYIAHKLKNRIAANNFFNTVYKAISSLKIMPERYRRIPFFKEQCQCFRKLIVKDYVIIYVVNSDTKEVYILHIFHGNQNYLDLL